MMAAVRGNATLSRPAPKADTRPCGALRISFTAAALLVATCDTAFAYVGDSFLQLPGVVGDWRGDTYKRWIKLNANYWQAAPLSNFARYRKDRKHYSGPLAPRHGESSLMLSIDKHSPVLHVLMDLCAKKVLMPRAMFAESSQLSREPSIEVGPRPAAVPEYFEYALKDVTLTDCPVVTDAPDQALVVSFKDIEWLNYQGEPDGEVTLPVAATLPPAEDSGQTLSFVLNWFGYAHDVADNQCETVSAKPTERDYYALMSQEDAAKERERLASKGGPSYPDGQMCLRGPHQLNACRLPGIVPDPGQPEPKSTTARGLNLDNDDGRGVPPANTCRHKNYTSPDGQTGIDNQLYRVMGCMPGFMGHKGMLLQYENEQRHSGQLSIIVQISGIDDLKNDDSIEVTLLYSSDPMAKSADGKQVLPDYTFRSTDDPEFTSSFARWHGRIVGGVILTDPLPSLQLNIPLEVDTVLYNARMRLEILADGSLKGVLGGYQDWRHVVTANGHSQQESLFGGNVSAMYNAMKRAADGLKDPVTGECAGISSAYDIEGTPAFVRPRDVKALVRHLATPSPENH
jgi:hypothetical protein